MVKVCSPGWAVSHGGFHRCEACGFFEFATRLRPFWRRWVSSSTSDRTLCNRCAGEHFNEIEEAA